MLLAAGLHKLPPLLIAQQRAAQQAAAVATAGLVPPPRAAAAATPAELQCPVLSPAHLTVGCMDKDAGKRLSVVQTQASQDMHHTMASNTQTFLLQLVPRPSSSQPAPAGRLPTAPWPLALSLTARWGRQTVSQTILAGYQLIGHSAPAVEACLPLHSTAQHGDANCGSHFSRHHSYVKMATKKRSCRDMQGLADDEAPIQGSGHRASKSSDELIQGEEMSTITSRHRIGA